MHSQQAARSFFITLFSWSAFLGVINSSILKDDSARWRRQAENVNANTLNPRTDRCANSGPFIEDVGLNDLAVTVIPGQIFHSPSQSPKAAPLQNGCNFPKVDNLVLLSRALPSYLSLVTSQQPSPPVQQII